VIGIQASPLPKGSPNSDGAIASGRWPGSRGNLSNGRDAGVSLSGRLADVGERMKFAASVAVTYVLLAGCIFTVRCGRTQVSSSPAVPAASDGADDNNLRRLFSQPGLPAGSASRTTLDADTLLRTGLLRGQAGDFAGAIKAFKNTLAVHPNSAEAHYNLGLALLANGGNIPPWGDALVQFQAAADLRPDYAAAHRMAGVALLELGDAGKAIPELKLGISLDPSSGEAHFDLGRALTSTGNASGANAEYLSALKLKSPYPDAEYALAKELLSQRKIEAAIEHFHAALAAQPDFESAHYGLAQALKAEGRADESKVELKAVSLLLRRQSDAVLSSHLSNESLDRAKQGDMQSALDLARKAIWLNPANALANFNLGLLLADAGNSSASIHQLRKAISLAPFRISFYLDLARVQEMAGDPEGAMATLDRAKRIDATNPELSTALKMYTVPSVAGTAASGHALTPGGQFAFGAPSDTADGHFAFATRLSEEGDFLGAIGEMRQALIFAPTRGDIRYSSAIAMTQIGRDDEAEFELRNVLRLAPASPPAHLALGSFLFERRDLASAAAEFREVLRVQPGNAQALKLLKECAQDR
jgi:tetratricopeptide (TPR) repeat protein